MRRSGGGAADAVVRAVAAPVAGVAARRVAAVVVAAVAVAAVRAAAEDRGP